MNSACWSLAVCSTTHGAILFAVAVGAGGPPWPVAREEPIAANTAIAATTKNNEQNIRRRRDGLSVWFGFVMIELPGNLVFVFIGVGFVEVGSSHEVIFRFTGLYRKQEAKF
jgi:hypothetical protein